MAAADVGARFAKGENVHMMEHIGGSGGVEAGEIVVLEEVAGIAHLPIAEGDKGSLAIFGGEYESNLFASATAVGEAVYWNAGTETITLTNTDTFLGYCTQAAAAGGGATGRFFHALP